MVRRTARGGERRPHHGDHPGVPMKRMIVLTAALLVAAAPAAVGLAGNSSLSPTVPVAPPTQAVVDDDGGATDRDARTEVGDDRAVQGGVATPSPTPVPSSSPSS